MCPLTSEKLLPKELHCRTKDNGQQIGWDQTASQSSIISPPIPPIMSVSMTGKFKILVKLIAALGFKWNALWH